MWYDTSQHVATVLMWCAVWMAVVCIMPFGFSVVVDVLFHVAIPGSSVIKSVPTL